MATIISTKTSGVGGLEVTGDATGILQLASNNGTTAITVDASQNVGIGTNSPTSSLVVAGAVTGTPTVNGVHLGVQSGYAAIELVGTSGTGSFIDFTQSGTDFKGRILYDNPSNTMILNTNGTERMRIDSNGYVTKPYQVGFKAGRGTSAQSVANNTACIFNTTAAAGGFNTGNAYNTSTGNFTAPIAGRYIFNTSVIFEGVANGTNFSDIIMTVNGAAAAYGLRQLYVTNTTGSGGYFVDKIDAIMNLAAGDVVAVLNNTGSTKTLHANSAFSIFCGYLLG